jgi:sugar O-acyltransferase (sialic acid O-acetyltransferase NeuD family)
MYKLIIVGAGGLGKEIYSQLIGDSAHDVVWRIDSFIDDAYDGQVKEVINGIKLTGGILNHQPSDCNVYVLGVSNPHLKEGIVNILEGRGAIFVPICTKMTKGQNVDLSDAFYAFDVRISNNVKVGKSCYIDSQNIISHDVTLGNYCHLGPRNFIAGNVIIGDRVIIQGGACIAKGLTVGEGAEVGLGSVVLRNVPPHSLVIGNPARVVRNLRGE